MLDTWRQVLNLSEAVRIGERIARNRFCVQPMEAGDAGIGGLPSKYTMERYHRYAAGGAGIVVIEAVTMQYRSRSTNHQLMLDVDDAANVVFWRRFFRHMKELYPDTLFIMQLQHAGEFSSEAFSRRVCVKAHPAFGGEMVDTAYVDGVVDKTIRTAVCLHEMGCDGVDMKFCHGYLGSQILRPFNDRNWKYGGSWENRSRFAYDICEGIRRIVPDHRFLVGAKLSLFEDIEGGQDLSEMLDLAAGLEARGADFFIESLGNAHLSWELMAPNKRSRENLYKHLAAARLLKNSLKPETVVIGGGLSVLGSDFPAAAEYAVSSGLFDMAGIGRQAFADPFLPEKYAAGRLDEVNWCLCCDQCGRMLQKGMNSYCAVY